MLLLLRRRRICFISYLLSGCCSVDDCPGNGVFVVDVGHVFEAHFQVTASFFVLFAVRMNFRLTTRIELNITHSTIML